MKATYRDCLLPVILLALLLALFWSRLWNLGLTHTDDAVWALRAWDTPGNIFDTEPVGEWARRQGRFWAFVSGALMLHVIKWNATAYGELLRFAGFAAFFATFHYAVRAYCGVRIALLAATLNLSLAMVHWDGSVLTTYPLITWVAGTALAAALLCGKRYVAGAPAGWLVAAALLMFFSFMNNEGVTAAFALVAVLAALATREESRSRGMHFVGAAATAALAYGALYAGWRMLHPSQYAGHEVSWQLKPFLVAFWHFSTGGSVLHDLASPYRVTFADPQAGVEYKELYSVWGHWKQAIGSPAAWIAAGLGGMLVLRGAHAKAGEARSSVNAVVAGLVIALVAIAPVALSAMYQGWVMEKGIRAYSHTPLAHFGWCLVLAALLARAFDLAGRRRVVAVATAGVVAVLAALASATNDDIAADMRPESGRWRVMRDLLDANAAASKAPTLIVPRFANGSWYVWVPKGYWSQYTKARWNDSTLIDTQAAPDTAPPASAMVADYAWEGAVRGFTGLIAPLRASQDSRSAGQAIVWTEANSQDGLVLVYPEGGRTVRKQLGPGLHAGHVNVAAVPLPDVDWVRIERQDGEQAIPLIDLNLRTGKVANRTWPVQAVRTILAP